MKFPYYHMPLEILIVGNMPILQVLAYKHNTENKDFVLQGIKEPKLSGMSWRREMNAQNKPIP